MLAALRRFDQVLGVLDAAPESIDAEIEALIARRNAARARKDFAAADAIRHSSPSAASSCSTARRA